MRHSMYKWFKKKITHFFLLAFSMFMYYVNEFEWKIFGINLKREEEKLRK